MRSQKSLLAAEGSYE